MKFDQTYRQIGDVNTPYPQYVFKPDVTDKRHYLGGGAFGEVFKGFALERNYQPVAVKKIALKTLQAGGNKEIMHSVDKEIEAFKLIKGMIEHENILQIYDVLRSPNNLYIVMEYCRHGDLEMYLKKKKRLTESEAVECLRQITEALGMLHKNGFKHRDIKPANILIDDGVYKVCDYGLSSVAQANPASMRKLSSVGSPLYAAPEILLGKSYNTNVDIFSTGVMIYEAIYQHTPWPARSLPELVEKQKRQKVIKFPKHPKISKDLMVVLQRMCLVDQFKRPTFEQLQQIPEFKKIVHKEDEFIEKYKKQKDPVMKSIMMFNHQSKFQGAHGHVNKTIKKKIEKLQKEDKDIDDKYDDGIQAPNVQQHKDSRQQIAQKHKPGTIKKVTNQEEQNNFEMQASQINQALYGEEYIKNEYDRINRRVDFDLLKVQLANQAIEQFQGAQHFFPNLKKEFKSGMIFLLAKYQCLKITDLKRNLFSQKNIYKEEPKIWKGYLSSKQFQKKVANIKYQSKLSYYILQKLYGAQKANFQFYYNVQNQSFMNKLKQLFNIDVTDMTDYPQVCGTIKGLTGYILNDVQMAMTMENQDQEVWSKKLVASTYLLYVVMYEEYYRFNPKNQMTFGEIVELVERYGPEQLQNNLMQSISQYNKSQMQQQQQQKQRKR